MSHPSLSQKSIKGNTRRNANSKAQRTPSPSSFYQKRGSGKTTSVLLVYQLENESPSKAGANQIYNDSKSHIVDGPAG